jgi:hypothetical protein
MVGKDVGSNGIYGNNVGINEGSSSVLFFEKKQEKQLKTKNGG